MAGMERAMDEPLIPITEEQREYVRAWIKRVQKDDEDAEALKGMLLDERGSG